MANTNNFEAKKLKIALKTKWKNLSIK